MCIFEASCTALLRLCGLSVKLWCKILLSVRRESSIICPSGDGCCYNLHVTVTDWTGGYSTAEALRHRLLQICNTEWSVSKSLIYNISAVKCLKTTIIILDVFLNCALLLIQMVTAMLNTEKSENLFKAQVHFMVPLTSRLMLVREWGRKSANVT